MQFSRSAAALTAIVGVMGMLSTTDIALAQTADMILLDFETAATGAAILSEPFVTPDGTITASAVGGQLFLLASGGTQILLHDQSDDDAPDFGELAFDFDVSSITFNFDGFSAGEILAEVLDAEFNVLDTFFDPDTSNDHPGGPVTLAGQGIRYFRFRDTDPDRVSVGIDNVSYTIVQSVPDQIDGVLDMIEELEIEGTLTGGLANALTVKLEAARNQANHQPQAAIGQMGALVRQVAALVRQNVLAAAEGQALIDAAQEIIAALGG